MPYPEVGQTEAFKFVIMKVQSNETDRFKSRETQLDRFSLMRAPLEPGETRAILWTAGRLCAC